MFKLFRIPEPGEQIVAGGDVGSTWDNCSAHWISKERADQVMVFNEKMDSTQFGFQLYYAGKYISNMTGIWPKLAIEANTGLATINKCLELNYPDLYLRKNLGTEDQTETGQVGWRTDQITRPKMLDDLKYAVFQEVITINDVETLQQMMDFIKEKGRPQGRRGKPDDLVMALAITWQMFIQTPKLPDRTPPGWYLNRKGHNTSYPSKHRHLGL